MKTKIISLAVLSLGVCTLAMAAEYKSPDVAFKSATPSHKVTKVAEFNEEYKVEGAVKTDRQIASEQEVSDREPSSVVAHDKKYEDAPAEHVSDDKQAPTPWTYRNKLDFRVGKEK